MALIFAVICSNFAFLSLLGSMTEYYSNWLARMDLKAETTVTIQVDLNTGWYAHDFFAQTQEGMGSDAGWGGGGGGGGGVGR